MTEITGKAAVVTGGGSGIGMGLAKELAKQGASVAVALGRLVRGLLFQVPSVSPELLGVVIATLAAIALVACWIPARRAAAAGPGALRVE